MLRHLNLFVMLYFRRRSWISSGRMRIWSLTSCPRSRPSLPRAAPFGRLSFTFGSSMNRPARARRRRFHRRFRRFHRRFQTLFFFFILFVFFFLFEDFDRCSKQPWRPRTKWKQSRKRCRRQSEAVLGASMNFLSSFCSL